MSMGSSYTYIDVSSCGSIGSGLSKVGCVC